MNHKPAYSTVSNAKLQENSNAALFDQSHYIRRESSGKALGRTIGGGPIVYILIATLIMLWSVFSHRENLLDQGSYEMYFNDADYASAYQRFMAVDGVAKRAAYVVTEEVGWQLICAGLGVVFTPSTCVRIVVVALNLLIILALWRSKTPVLGLVAWILAPSALACIGCYQIRQGLGFGVFLFYALYWKRPMVGAILASTIHTTFLIPLVVLVVVRIAVWVRVRGWPAMICASIAGTIFAFIGVVLFPVYGGRRAGMELVEIVDLNWKFLVFQYLALAITLYAIGRRVVSDALARDLMAMYVGTIFFVAVSFFAFKIGTDRVSYFADLFLCFLALRSYDRKDDVFAIIGISMIFIVMVMLGLKLHDYNQFMLSLGT